MIKSMSRMETGLGLVGGDAYVLESLLTNGAGVHVASAPNFKSTK